MATKGSQVLDECVDEDYEPTKEGTKCDQTNFNHNFNDPFWKCGSNLFTRNQ